VRCDAVVMVQCRSACVGGGGGMRRHSRYSGCGVCRGGGCHTLQI